jgi:hypothetical protein
MKRIQFQFDNRTWAALKSLQGDLHRTSLAGTVRYCIAITGTLVKYMKQGYTLELRRGEEVKEVVDPMLQLSLVHCEGDSELYR